MLIWLFHICFKSLTKSVCNGFHKYMYDFKSSVITQLTFHSIWKKRKTIKCLTNFWNLIFLKKNFKNFKYLSKKNPDLSRRFHTSYFFSRNWSLICSLTNRRSKFSIEDSSNMITFNIFMYMYREFLNDLSLYQDVSPLFHINVCFR